MWFILIIQDYNFDVFALILHVKPGKEEMHT